MEKRGELAPLVQSLLSDLEDEPQAVRVPLLAFVRALDLPSTPAVFMFDLYEFRFVPRLFLYILDEKSSDRTRAGQAA